MALWPTFVHSPKLHMQEESKQSSTLSGITHPINILGFKVQPLIPPRKLYVWNTAKPNYNGPWGQEVWHERNNNYYYGIFWGGMPDLNYNNTEVTQEIKDIVRFGTMMSVSMASHRCCKALIHVIVSKKHPCDPKLVAQLFCLQKGINPRLSGWRGMDILQILLL